MLLSSGWGLWYLFETVGTVAIPALVYIYGIRTNNVKPIQAAAFVTAFGILLNRLNISVIAFKWYLPNHYYPSVSEIIITLAVISGELWVLRFFISRMAILREHPAFPEHGHEEKSKAEVLKWKVSA
jgi:Ni/Fe-hydrogenase subunit HybB-like protein